MLLEIKKNSHPRYRMAFFNESKSYGLECQPDPVADLPFCLPCGWQVVKGIASYRSLSGGNQLGRAI
jgi:hypothetical protein